MSIINELENRGLVTARKSAERSEEFPEDTIVMLKDNESMTNQVNEALKKVNRFNIDVSSMNPPGCNYVFIEAKEDDEELHQALRKRKMPITDLYAEGLTLQINVGHIEPGDWENCKPMSTEQAMEYRRIPASLSLDGRIFASTTLSSLKDLPAWIGSRVRNIEGRLLEKVGLSI